MEPQDVVMLTVPEFACLTFRTEDHIKNQLRNGKIKGYQTRKWHVWHIPESELGKYWGELGASDPIKELIDWALGRDKRHGKRASR